jgi:IS5 family transposase
VPKRRKLNDTEIKEKNGKYCDVMQGSLDGRAENRQEQIDLEARFTKKNNEIHFGYKDHTCVDIGSKIITDYTVTSAEVHDSKVFVQFVKHDTVIIYADSAYATDKIKKQIREINPRIKIRIIFRKYRNTPLTKYQKRQNKIMSKVRCGVEHVFGFMTRSMGGMTSNVIGFVRNRRNIGLKNLESVDLIIISQFYH